jgi:hypothetical protein
MEVSMLRTNACTLSLLLLAACGPAPEPASPPAATTATTSAADEAPSAAAGADPAPTTTASAKPDDKMPVSDSETLARDLLKSGGRRIGYSESKGFVYPIEKRTPASFGLNLYFLSLDGQKKEPLQICQLGECEEKLDEAIKVELPKLASRLGADGYTAIRGVGWPAGSDELELAGVGLKLKYGKGTLAAIRKGKPNATLAQVGGKRIDAPAIQAVFIVPGGKLLGAYSAPKGDPSGPAEDFYVFKMP